MGNKGTKDDKSEVVDNQEAVVNHPKINNVTIHRTNKDHSYMETNMPIIDKKDYDTWVKSMKHSPAEKSEYALHPRKHDLKKDKTCGKSGMANIEYDNYSYTLRDQIRNRQKIGLNKFQETQIWYLLNCLADVAEKFHDKKQKVGDIRPENVFVNDNGQLKLSTVHSWPKETTNYDKYFYDHEPTLLAPEELTDIQIGKSATTADPELAESFSIGMTALDSALLDDSERMYNKNNFDQDTLEYKRNQLFNEPKYSELLKIVIGNLTARKPNKRMTAHELKDFLRPNQEKIVSLQNYSVNDIPDKLKQTVKKIRLPGSLQQPVSSVYQPRTTISTEFIPTFPEMKVQQRESQAPQNQSKYRMTLAEIQEKVSKSRAMYPS